MRSYFAVALLAVVTILASPAALAVPSFARQTGMACAACHTVFPELTPFGREFKLNGYVISNLKTIRDISTNRQDILELNETPPLSFMFQTSITSLHKALPDSSDPSSSAQNGTLRFPQQASLFYAGRIGSKVGAFVQMTYEQASDAFGWDNTDIRYADNLSSADRGLVWGVTLNNAPTVQDVWNSTPAWGFPYASSGVAPTPTAATLVEGGADNGFAGVSAYGWWNNSLYGELGVYRSAPAGIDGPLDSNANNVISGLAPYWRLAYERKWGRNSLEVGTFGLSAKLFPGGGTPLSGAADKYTDAALDAQYQFIGDRSIYSVLGTYIHEKQNLDATFAAGGSANPENHLNSYKLVGSYFFDRRYGGSVGLFGVSGSADAGRYAPNPVDGSANGSPNSNGEIFELDYLPWLNTKFSLQYIAYNKFNGGKSNYDGSGRSASDNNTLYLVGWFNF